MQDDRVNQLTKALLELDIESIKSILSADLSFSKENSSLKEDTLIQSQIKIGELWEKGEIALSQVYMAGKTCEEIISELNLKRKDPSIGDVPIYTVVLEDFHVLGEKMLISILQMAGFTVIDYGFGISVADLVQKVQHDNCQILMISTLMLNSALRVKALVSELKARNLKTKVIVGGAPFNIDPNLWKTVGADATASTATKSITILHDLMEDLS